MFSNTLSFLSSRNDNDQVSHPHKSFSSSLCSLLHSPVTSSPDDGYWKIKIDQEINDILKGQNIIGFIKEQRLKWPGHVERTAEDNIVQKIKRWKPMSKGPIGRPKTRWEDDGLGDTKSMDVSNWKKVAQNRDSWKEVLEQARTLYRL
jgi:hypothetical protein